MDKNDREILWDIANMMENPIQVNIRPKDISMVFSAIVVANIATVGLFVGLQKLVTWREEKKEASQD